jgi:hypothetical protein
MGVRSWTPSRTKLSTKKNLSKQTNKHTFERVDRFETTEAPSSNDEPDDCFSMAGVCCHASQSCIHFHTHSTKDAQLPSSAKEEATQQAPAPGSWPAHWEPRKCAGLGQVLISPVSFANKNTMKTLLKTQTLDESHQTHTTKTKRVQLHIKSKIATRHIKPPNLHHIA